MICYIETTDENFSFEEFSKKYPKYTVLAVYYRECSKKFERVVVI